MPSTSRLLRAVVAVAAAAALVAAVGALTMSAQDDPVVAQPSAAGATGTGSPTTGAAPTTGAPTTAVVPTEPRRLSAPVAPSPSRAAGALDVAGATDPDGTLAVTVLDLETGDVASGPYSDDTYYSASMVKLIVAIDVLDQRRAGVAIDERDLANVTAALGPSNDQAMNALWSELDGAGAVTRVATELGLTSTSPPADPSEWGATQTSANDLATVYAHVRTGLPAEDSSFLLGALDAATPEAADGFDQGFGLLGVGAASTKQGWACCYEGEVVLHSAGILDDRYVVVLLTAVPRGAGYDGARAELDAAAAAAAAALA